MFTEFVSRDLLQDFILIFFVFTCLPPLLYTASRFAQSAFRKYYCCIFTPSPYSFCNNRCRFWF